MKVKHVLALSATIVGNDELAAYLNGQACDDVPVRQEESAKLLAAYNLALEEVAIGYERLIKKEKAPFSHIISYSSLSDRPLEIISVESETGRPLRFEKGLEDLIINDSADQAVICYIYLPDGRTGEDECDYGMRTHLTPRALAYCTAAEYLRLIGAKDAARDVRERFELIARDCLRPKGKLVIRGRRW